MALLSVQQIFDAQDFETKDVEVPEWGGTVRIKTLSASERDEFETSTVKTNKAGRQEQNLENFRARYVALCAINEDGSPLFKNRQEVKILGNKSAKALDRVFAAATELNRMTEEDVEELTQDFDKDPDEDSTSE